MNLTFYEPPMCCPTGVCGPSIDGKLVTLVEQISELQERFDGLVVERHMISTAPLKFRENSEVFKTVKESGKGALPITTVNGKIIKISEYPTMEEIVKHLSEV